MTPLLKRRAHFAFSWLDSRVQPTNLMLKCTEIGGEFIHGVEQSGEWERRGRWRGWSEKSLSEGKGQSRESASASSVNVIARMWKMRCRGSRAKRKVRACLTQNNWLEDGLIRPLNQLPLVPFPFFPVFYLLCLLFHIFYSLKSVLEFLNLLLSS